MDLNTANRLQQLRKENGYSQEVLAEKLGISRQSISKWERGESSPETDNLVALARLYGISIDSLLNKDSTENTDVIKTDFKAKAKSLLSKANDFGIYPKVAFSMLKFPYPLIVVMLYVGLCMAFRIWHPLWVVFITIAIYYQFAIACKANNKKVFLYLMPVPEVVLICFFISGFTTGQWGYSYLLMLIVPIYYWVVSFIKVKR